MNQDKKIKVVHVSDDFTAVLNYGSEDGAELDQKFLIYSIGDEIFDPDTKESLGHLEIIKGTGVIVSLQPKMCTISSASYKTPPAVITYQDDRTLFGTSKTVKNKEPEQLPFKDIRISDLAKRIG